jgi:Arc/MetJ-type ribon-helix-helix transcriptional regulator
MQKMKRFSIPVSDELEERVAALRKTDKFLRSSYSEIIRELMLVGLRQFESEDQDETALVINN